MNAAAPRANMKPQILNIVRGMLSSFMVKDWVDVAKNSTSVASHNKKAKCR